MVRKWHAALTWGLLYRVRGTRVQGYTESTRPLLRGQVERADGGGRLANGARVAHNPDLGAIV